MAGMQGKYISNSSNFIGMITDASTQVWSWANVERDVGLNRLCK